MKKISALVEAIGDFLLLIGVAIGVFSLIDTLRLFENFKISGWNTHDSLALHILGVYGLNKVAAFNIFYVVGTAYQFILAFFLYSMRAQDEEKKDKFLPLFFIIFSPIILPFFFMIAILLIAIAFISLIYFTFSSKKLPSVLSDLMLKW